MFAVVRLMKTDSQRAWGDLEKGIKGNEKLLGIKKRGVWIRKRNSMYDVCVKERLNRKGERRVNIESRWSGFRVREVYRLLQSHLLALRVTYIRQYACRMVSTLS